VNHNGTIEERPSKEGCFGERTTRAGGCREERDQWGERGIASASSENGRSTPKRKKKRGAGESPGREVVEVEKKGVFPRSRRRAMKKTSREVVESGRGKSVVGSQGGAISR